MRLPHLFAAVILINSLTYSSCTVLATTGYVFSSPSVRNFLIETGLSTLIGRKASTLYDVSNFRYVSDRGTDIKKAQMDNFEIVEIDPKQKIQRTGMHVHEEQNFTKEEDRVYSEKLFSVLTEMDRNGCISRLLCEIGAEPQSFGIVGIKINHYLKSVPPVTWNSATFSYLEAFRGGLHDSKAVCGLHYAMCAYDLRRVMKFMWPFLMPINMKLASRL